MIRKWFNEQVLFTFTGRTLSIDTKVALFAASLNVSNPRPFCDCLIAATALVYNMILVTRNVEDFRISGLKIINPWQPSDFI